MIDWAKNLSRLSQVVALTATVLLLLTSIMIYLNYRSAEDASDQQAIVSSNYVDAKSTPVSGRCLSESPELKIGSSDRGRLELIAMSHLMDVPAGTEVDINFATYSYDQATGSSTYPEKYGSYNFVLTKKSGDWAVAEFKRCD